MFIKWNSPRQRELCSPTAINVTYVTSPRRVHLVRPHCGQSCDSAQIDQMYHYTDGAVFLTPAIISSD